MKLWGGRFEHETDAAIAAFTSSLPFDQRLAYCDIRGSIAHAHVIPDQKLPCQRLRGIRLIERL